MRNHHCLTINGVILEEVNQHCHLVLIIYKSLTWENHINYILGKAGKIVNIMRCLKYTLPRKALERLFINRIRLLIGYADVIYDNSAVIRKNTLFDILAKMTFFKKTDVYYTKN